MSPKLARKMTANDIYQFKLVSDPAFSPDANHISYTVTTIDEESDGYLSSIYLASPESGNNRRLTRANAKDSQAQWSPDGKHLAFLSNRSEDNQIWMIRTSGGEAWQVSELDDGVSRFVWSPDGTSFAAVSKAVDSDDQDDTSEEKSDVKHITKIRYKSNEAGFLDFKPAHLWIVPAFGGDARQLTDADISDSDPVWSPTGREIAFVTNRTELREMNSVSEIWSVSVESGQEQPRLSGEDASFGSPAWSPDGSKLVAIGHWEAQAGGSPDSNIWMVQAGGGDPQNLTEDFPRSVGDSAMSDVYQGSSNRPLFSPDGNSIYFLASDTGSTYIYRADTANGEIEKLTKQQRRVSGVSLSPDGSQLAFVMAKATNPGDLYIAASGGDKKTRLTTLNKDFLSGIALSKPERFSVESPEGGDVQAWMLKPVDFDSNRKYPMILEIHGGPHGMYAEAFMHEFQLMAARGYVVVYCNPRGSSGYGEAFTRDSHKRWGEADMPDVMAVVDHVLEQGFIDEARMGVTGGSYGGYMTLWVIGHTDRFKAAVTQRCVSNLYSFYGTSDIGWTFIDYEFGGLPWENREHYMKYSPITYVENMTTPLLIIHSELDFRCPIEQGEQVFISLKRLGRETEFVRFPDENHNLSRNGKPGHRIERLEHIIGWFDRHL